VTDDPLTLARTYVAAGLSVLPIKRGSKRPDARLLPLVQYDGDDHARPGWRPYEHRLASDAELTRWFAGSQPAGVGIIGGAISGGLLILDLESADAYQQWRSNAEALLDTTILDCLPVVRTGKGFHLYARTSEPGGNQKLAMQDGQTIAETRGEGGYVLAPPTMHPETQQPYTLIHGDLTTIPHLTAAQARALLDAARALVTEEHPSNANASGQNGSVIDRFNQEHTIEQVLERHGYRREQERRYIRPGGERSSVVIVNGKSVHYNTNDPLSSEAPGGKPHAHTPFSAWCVLEHHGDVKQAVRAAAQELGMAHNRSSQEARTPISDTTLLEQIGRSLGLTTGDDDAPDTWPYFVYEGGLWMHRTERDGSPKTPQLLTSFTARITAETDIDNGETIEQAYTIQATCGSRTRQIDMSRKDFESEGALARIVAALGARARVNPQAHVRYVMDAFKALSHHIEERTIYTHTGWAQHGYLFGNGYIDRDGWHPATTPDDQRAHLKQRLERYVLTPPAESSLDDAQYVFDELLELAPTSVMIPLVGAVWLAPILPWLEAAAPLVHLYAPTGSHKTALICAVVSLVGRFMPDHPTDTWGSTTNSIQRLGWHLKDCIMLLDDYKRAHVKSDRVTHLVQNYGDGVGKGRLNSQSELRATYPIRGVIISSGEDQPEGEASTLARILSVEMGKGVVHLERLTRLQTTDGPYLHLLTIDYLRWLIVQGALHEELRDLHHTTRAAMLAQLTGTEHAANPGRIASNVATLYVSWVTFCRFLVQREHWTQERVDAWLRQAKTDLLALARRQLDLTTGERYSALFIEAVQGLLASGKAVLLHAERERLSIESGQVVIGARAPDGIYLVVETAYNEVSKAARAAGGAVGYSKKALGQLLYQDGLLLADEKRISYTVQKRINGVRTWCWRLHPAVLD
jgi:hypothetical protein